MAISLEIRLLARIEFDTSQWGCWLWAGSLGSHGYGQMHVDGRPQLVHRIAFRLWRGELPLDKPNICHHCDTRPCIRPDHLFAGTKADNSADMARKGRAGERKSILTATDIPVIRARLAAGELQRSIAADYGVARQTITKIGAGKRWRRYLD